jgi:hypothetical protein
MGRRRVSSRLPRRRVGVRPARLSVRRRSSGLGRCMVSGLLLLRVIVHRSRRRLTVVPGRFRRLSVLVRRRVSVLSPVRLLWSVRLGRRRSVRPRARRLRRGRPPPRLVGGATSLARRGSRGVRLCLGSPVVRPWTPVPGRVVARASRCRPARDARLPVLPRVSRLGGQLSRGVRTPRRRRTSPLSSRRVARRAEGTRLRLPIGTPSRRVPAAQVRTTPRRTARPIRPGRVAGRGIRRSGRSRLRRSTTPGLRWTSRRRRRMAGARSVRLGPGTLRLVTARRRAGRLRPRRAMRRWRTSGPPATGLLAGTGLTARWIRGARRSSPTTALRPVWIRRPRVPARWVPPRSSLAMARLSRTKPAADSPRRRARPVSRWHLRRATGRRLPTSSRRMPRIAQPPRRISRRRSRAARTRRRVWSRLRMA